MLLLFQVYMQLLVAATPREPVRATEPPSQRAINLKGRFVVRPESGGGASGRTCEVKSLYCQCPGLVVLDSTYS